MSQYSGTSTSCLISPVGDAAEFLDAGGEFFRSEGLQTAGGKGLAGEGGEDRAVDDRLADDGGGVGRRALCGEVAGHTAEEGIARAGGIGDGGEGKGGAAEEVGRS